MVEEMAKHDFPWIYVASKVTVNDLENALEEHVAGHS